ncbi:MAG: hypothetical protein IJ516_06555, partial [Phascolarctobacterium sp.]|nr:hypothetical protein [Phascolarctobacterium sp.]
EMAQIVAKAMAKGANVDKLAAEFADELDTLGVRVAKLEKGADAVKITGQARLSYDDVDTNDGKRVPEEFKLRTRLWVAGTVNDNWTYKGMLESIQDLNDNDGEDDDVRLRRVFMEGRLGGLDVTAGRYNEMPYTGNVLDVDMDGVRVAYGKDVKVFGAAGKAYGVDLDDNTKLSSDDRVYVAGVEAPVGAVDAYAVYYKTDAYATQGKNQEIWNVGATYGMGDFTLAAEYMWGDDDNMNPAASKDGWYADLAWKGADANVPGSYGLHVAYYDQSVNAYIAPTTDAYLGAFDGGYKGFAYGASYAFAKNIVGVVNYYDFEDQVGSEEAETIFSELYFFF